MRIVLAAFSILSIVGLSACATSPYLGAAFNDLESDAALATALSTDEEKRFKDVDITVFEGRILLTGTVPNEKAQMDLLSETWKVEGVKQVIDETVVGDDTNFGRGLADTRIDATIRTRLVANEKVRSSDVKLAVSNGVVYLLGVARDRDALESLVHTARTSQGVAKVVSHVQYVDAGVQRL